MRRGAPGDERTADETRRCVTRGSASGASQNRSTLPPTTPRSLAPAGANPLGEVADPSADYKGASSSAGNGPHGPCLGSIGQAERDHSRWPPSRSATRGLQRARRVLFDGQPLLPNGAASSTGRAGDQSAAETDETPRKAATTLESNCVPAPESSCSRANSAPGALRYGRSAIIAS